MNRAALDRVAAAVLYEGYLLYPYRPSSVKNQQRWTFGAIFPPAWAEAEGGSDRSFIQAQVLLQGEHPVLEVSARLLQLCERSGPGGATFQEAVEREVPAPARGIAELIAQPLALPFAFRGGSQQEEGIARRQLDVEGVLEIEAESVGERLFRATIRVRNTGLLAAGVPREEALLRAMVSTHLLLGARGGELVSLLDPPESAVEAARACENLGVWPVLVGEEGRRDTMIASPIILYDHPQIAPESPGDLFDATEIDEILSLRILTLTDEEKREARACDPRARALLDRTEALSGDDLLKLHGAMRRLETDERLAKAGRDAGELVAQDAPVPSQAAGLSAGARVRLRPRAHGDVFDIALVGKEATVASIEQDLEGRLFLAVTLDDDPGKDLGLLGHPGHRFFFRPEEVEPLAQGAKENGARETRARARKVLIACVGNIFFGDDGFGVEVARRLQQRALPEGVRVVDFGIRGLDLAYALLDGEEAVILVDATRRGDRPGTLYVLEPEAGEAPLPAPTPIDTHGMQPDRVLALARAMGACPWVRVVGCEPRTAPPDPDGDEELVMGLSPEVEAAVEGALELIDSLLPQARGEPPRSPRPGNGAAAAGAAGAPGSAGAAGAAHA